MDPTFFSSNSKQFLSAQEENDNTTTSTPENSSDSPPPSTNFSDYSKITTYTSSPKKSTRRAIHKRVVSVPIKGDNSNSNTPPPSDSWAWRKYGQKPIKGSPYPRGYYRCSSSKGCPARKQVERSRVDPTTLVITYSSEHNHPWPASRNHHNNHNNSSSATATKRGPTKTEAPEAQQPDHQDQDLDQDQDSRFADLNHESLILNDEFVWFADMETTSSRVLESPIFADSSSSVGSDSGDKAAMVFPMGEEDESLFADLGELPECSFVFRHRGVGPQAQIC